MSNVPSHAHEQVLQLLQYQAAGVANSFPAVRGIMVAVLWESALGDLPFGTIVFRKGEELTPELILAGVQQTAKLTNNLTSNLQNWSGSLNATVKQQQEKIRELEEKLRSLAGQGNQPAQTPGSSNPS